MIRVDGKIPQKLRRWSIRALPTKAPRIPRLQLSPMTRVAHGSRVIAVSGPEAAYLPEGDFQVLCAHNPRVWKTARQNGYDLVLAGHLHGCQLVAFEYRNRLFPGAVFYPYCFLSHQEGSTRLVVSRGVSDLLPIRWRCPREVILCHV